jgi:hypothetical protein
MKFKNYDMKFFSKLITTLIVILLVLGQNVQASYIETDSLGKKGNQQKQTIVLIDVLQPLLFGKVGIAAGWRNIKHDYVFYGNYVFGKGAIPTTAFNLEKEEYVPFEERIGFDFGFQLKIRSKLLTKPYRNYIKDIVKINRFYYAPWIEVSKKSGSREFIPNRGGQRTSYDVWEYKAGLQIGWSFASEKSILLYDINLGLGAGWATGRLESAYPTGSPSQPIQYYLYERWSLIALYKVSFQIGFKL